VKRERNEETRSELSIRPNGIRSPKTNLQKSLITITTYFYQSEIINLRVTQISQSVKLVAFLIGMFKIIQS